MYQIRSLQAVPITPGKAWDFLSDPANLKKLTPEHMGFHILSGSERPMFPGQIIEYKISPFRGITTRWVTEISHVQEGEYFVDEQRFGPYAFWHHKHIIHPSPEGVLMEDIVDYKLPLGPLGKLAHALLVRKQLKRIFDYRSEKLIEMFGSIPGHSSTLELKTI